MVLLVILTTGLLLSPAPPPADADLVSTLKDIEKAYDVLHCIDDEEEQLHLLFGEQATGIRSYLTKFTRTCESLKGKTYSSASLNMHMQNYIDSTIKSYQAVNIPKPGIKNYKAELDAYDSHRKALADYLTTTYALDHFVHLTEDEYWKTMDKKKYILSRRYNAYLQLRSNNKPKALSVLDSIYRTTSNFQEKSIYALESADQYEKNSQTLSNGTEIAIAKYKAILDAKQYCLYLFETWAKWRAVTQQHNGLSKSSDIPNDQYDEVRDRVADVILAYIQQNPKDEMAINQFLVIVTHDIVFRFGDYPYGNQNTVEYHQIFEN